MILALGCLWRVFMDGVVGVLGFFCLGGLPL